MRARTLLTIFVTAAVLGAPLAAGAQAVVDPPGTRRVAPLAAPRVAPLSDGELTEAHKAIVARFTRDGKANNALRTLLRVPELAEAVMPYTTYLTNETSISPRHRELLILRIAWLYGNENLWAEHAPRARVYGLDDAAIRRIAEGPDASGWDRFDATLLRLADQQFRNSSTTNATWKALSERYDLFNIVDAIETVNHFTTLSIFYNSLGIQPDDELKDRLPADVPYRVTVPAREPALTVARILPNQGRGIAVSRTFGRYPLLNQRWSPRQNFILRTPLLTPQHREMLILRMGWNCQSEYEWAKHVGSVGRAREIGLDPVEDCRRRRFAGVASVREAHPAHGRRAVSRRPRLGCDLARPGDAVQAGADHGGDLLVERVSGNIHVAQCVRRPAGHAGRRAVAEADRRTKWPMKCCSIAARS